MFVESATMPRGARHLSTLALLLAVSQAATGAELAPVFTSHCVLQQSIPVALWGTGRDGEDVVVEIEGAAVKTTVAAGRWQVELPPLAPTSTTTLRLRSDTETVLHDVAVGEVWICSGQSNMEWRLNQCSPYTDALLATADNPDIRQIKVPLRAFAGDPLPRFEWNRFDKAAAPFFSAVAYAFAERLHAELGVPVGIINCSFGGTPIEAWMHPDALRAAGRRQLLDDDARKMAAFASPEAYEAAWAVYVAERTSWEDRKRAGTPEAELGPQPKEPYGSRTKSRPGTLHSSMLSLITPYTARGMLWYQGENNSYRPDEYAGLLPQFVARCRADWNRPDWPVFIGQLSSPSPGNPDDKDAYAIVREAQRATAASDAHSGFVVTLDHGERGNVHPVHKQPIGERFARLALGRVHGRTGSAAQSPFAIRATRTDGTIAVEFGDLPGRLEIRDASVPSLEVGPPSGPWQPAAASLDADGKRLVIDAAALPEGPVEVRYGWRNFCVLSLFTDEGLPVSPWRLPVAGTERPLAP
jgi:sialate O-acetylesterase